MLVGAPFAIALGLFAGLMEFVPYIGPFAAAAAGDAGRIRREPAARAEDRRALPRHPVAESYVLAPLVQHKAVYLPPAAILFAQVLMGAIVGALGVAVATPLAAAVMVAVSMLYVEDALGDKNAKVKPPGRLHPRPAVPLDVAVAPAFEVFVVRHLDRVAAALLPEAQVLGGLPK